MSIKDRKILEKENRKESILAAAETVMTTYGIDGLSIDLIANERNWQNEPSIYILRVKKKF
jgi:AcrR family transcriptional regulator